MGRHFKKSLGNFEIDSVYVYMFISTTHYNMFSDSCESKDLLDYHAALDLKVDAVGTKPSLLFKKYLSVPFLLYFFSIKH